VKDALTAEGYVVDWVEDGHEALWLAENYEFDLIVLDIMLREREIAHNPGAVSRIQSLAEG
jgi:DNA-binding response OmpR family regulator